MNDDAIKQMHELMVDGGLPMEAGWLLLRSSVFPQPMSPEQLEMLRTAFFSGAQHLFAMMMQVMDDGAEPTDQDMARMSAIAKELDDFVEQFKAKGFATKGPVQ